MTDTLYDRDFVVWTEQQAETLRRLGRERANLPLDWENLAEEIESVGRSERGEVGSLVGLILSHLMKLSWSPAERPRAGWESEIEHARDLLGRKLADSPSIRPLLPALVFAELPRARRAAARGLRRYGEEEAAREIEASSDDITPDQVLDPEWFPPRAVPERNS